MSTKILFNRYGEPYPQNQEINAKLDAILDSIGDLQKEVAELKTDVAGLKIDVAGLKTDVTVLKKDVEHNKAAIYEIKADINSARWQVMVLLITVVAMVAAMVSVFK